MKKPRRALAAFAVPFLFLPLAVVDRAEQPSTVETTAGTERPNVVVVMTDDQDLASTQFMPRLQRLIGDQGVRFAKHTPSFSLCCPARATYLTGQFAHNNNVRGNGPPQGGYGNLNAEQTLPVWLQAAGYATAHMGKYPNGYSVDSHPLTSGVPPGWTDWRGAVDPTTYFFYNYTLNENGKLVTYGSDPKDYQADVLTRKGTKFIRKQADRPEPFFLSLAYLAPHWEYQPGTSGEVNLPPIEGAGNPETQNTAPPVPAPRHQGMFTGTTAPRPPSYDEADVSDKPAFVRNRPRLSQAYRDRIDSWYPRRLESLQAVDEGIEQIVNTLAETGELDNTVFMFMSDNGWFQGEHRIAEQKLHVYEPSTRVPLMISGPGVQPGATVDEWTSNVDLVATILGLTGAQPGVAQDGMSLVPYLSGGPPVGRAVFHETSADERGYTAIRAGRWKYVEYATGERELYDLIADPHELASLHADPAQGPTMVRLAEMLQSLKNCQGSDCVVTGYQDSSP